MKQFNTAKIESSVVSKGTIHLIRLLFILLHQFKRTVPEIFSDFGICQKRTFFEKQSKPP